MSVAAIAAAAGGLAAQVTDMPAGNVMGAAPDAALARVLSDLLLLFTAAGGTMAIGYASSGSFPPAGRAAVSGLYARIVFPAMVFRGVAAIRPEKLDMSVVLVVLLGKLAVAGVCIVYSMLRLDRQEGSSKLAHAAALAMAASHSFDVTLGVPIAKVLYPDAVAYIYLNQSVQLVLVNPLLLMLIEAASGKGGAVVRRTIVGVATNPLVVMTALGLLAGQVFPAGLPASLGAVSKQVADAGPFLGYTSLGFAMANLGGTSANELRHAAVLGAMKLLIMPALYLALARYFGCSAGDDFLLFLGSLPASASVYALTASRGLSPQIVGPLVPCSIVLCVALVLLPLSPMATSFRAAEALRAAIGAVAVAAALTVCRTNPKKHARD